ncbi:MAG: hypothetical protein O9342_17320 [Beijerinckiaceae bacterium]|nr:hypothetical protein [Beijerinckiaceae bacterium]
MTEAAAPPAARRVQAALVLPLLATAVFALRIVERGEIWLDRTYWLTGLAGLGGLGGGLLVLLLAGPLGRIRRTARRIVTTGLVFCAGFMIAMLAGYLVYAIAISGQFEGRPDRYFRSVAFASMQTSLLFLVSVPPYLLPWPLPLLAGCAAWLLTGPAPAAKPVEPAPPRV